MISYLPFLERSKSAENLFYLNIGTSGTNGFGKKVR